MSVAAVIESIGGSFERSISSAPVACGDRRAAVSAGDAVSGGASGDHLRLLLAARPALEEILVAHSCPPSG